MPVAATAQYAVEQRHELCSGHCQEVTMLAPSRVVDTFCAGLLKAGLENEAQLLIWFSSQRMR